MKSSRFAFGKQNKAANHAETNIKKAESEFVLEFAAFSDIHIKDKPSIESERLQAAIHIAYRQTRKLDAIVITGDFTDGGQDLQYAVFKNVLDKNVQKHTEVIVNLGNHENCRKASDSHEYFQQVMGYGIDHVFAVNGYYFITLGVHYGDTYTDKQANWLQNQLEMVTKKNPDQPVFVLIHFPAYQTTIHSTENGRKTFKAVLEKYPQAIHISGHSHPPLHDPRTIHQDKFTSFMNSSLSYIFYERADYNGSLDTAPVAYFSIFKVTQANQVIIERYLIDDQNIENSIKLDNDFVIDIPKGVDGFRYKSRWYDNGSKPYFLETAAVSLTQKQDHWQITFDQALDQQFVYYYHISIKDLVTNEVVKVLKPNSPFYLVQVPERLMREFSANLSLGNTYEVTIVAFSVTTRASEPLVRTVTLE